MKFDQFRQLYSDCIFFKKLELHNQILISTLMVGYVFSKVELCVTKFNKGIRYHWNIDFFYSQFECIVSLLLSSFKKGTFLTSPLDFV